MRKIQVSPGTVLKSGSIAVLAAPPDLAKWWRCCVKSFSGLAAVEMKFPVIIKVYSFAGCVFDKTNCRKKIRTE